MVLLILGWSGEDGADFGEGVEERCVYTVSSIGCSLFMLSRSSMRRFPSSFRPFNLLGYVLWRCRSKIRPKKLSGIPSTILFSPVLQSACLFHDMHVV